ncbi:hypothetical protein B0H14DRAFT_3779702 [Mycena olivaceomarginata]|nr:hypothetical protein B0H14DRAFT_3779702 [Mycena olivaceomarginata]
MSPELIQGKMYNHKSDIWSLGCLIHQLCVLKPLFHEAKTQDELKELILAAEVPSLPKHYSESLDNVVKTMLVKKCTQSLAILCADFRSLAPEQLKTPWYQINVRSTNLTEEGEGVHPVNCAAPQMPRQ